MLDNENIKVMLNCDYKGFYDEEINIRKRLGYPPFKNLCLIKISGGDFDLDAAAFCLTDAGKVSSSDDFVFYGNLVHPSQAVQHMGDNTTGIGDGDDEQIKIDLTKVPANLTKIAFTVTIYDAEVRRQNFGQVSNAYVRIMNEENGEELVRYDLGEDFSIETAAVFGELYKNGEKVKTFGQEKGLSLAEFAD